MLPVVLVPTSAEEEEGGTSKGRVPHGSRTTAVGGSGRGCGCSDGTSLNPHVGRHGSSPRELAPRVGVGSSGHKGTDRSGKRLLNGRTGKEPGVSSTGGGGWVGPRTVDPPRKTDPSDASLPLRRPKDPSESCGRGGTHDPSRTLWARGSVTSGRGEYWGRRGRRSPRRHPVHWVPGRRRGSGRSINGVEVWMTDPGEPIHRGEGVGVKSVYNGWNP